MDAASLIPSDRDIRPNRRGSQRSGNLSTNIYERTSLALYNTIQGDPDATMRALLRPNSLSPREHQTIADQWAPESGIGNAILRTITNPVVLIGAALALRFPVLDAKAMVSTANKLKQYAETVPAALRGLFGLNENFAETPIPQHFQEINNEVGKFITRHLEKTMLPGVVAWRKAAGRVETAADEVRLALLAEPWHQTEEGLAHINERIGRANRSLSARGQPLIEELSVGQITPKARPYDHLWLDAWKGTRTGIRTHFDELEAADPGFYERLTKFNDTSGGGFLENWGFPRMPSYDKRRMDRMMERLVAGEPTAGIPESPNALRDRQRAGEVKVRARTLETRAHILTPDTRDLELLRKSGEAIDERAINSLDRLQAEMTLQKPERPASYSLRFKAVVQNYSHSLARGVAWNTGRRGEALLKEMQLLHGEERKALQLTGNQIGPKTELLRNHYLPLLLGRVDLDTAMRSTEWTAVRQFAWKAIESKAAKAFIPDGPRNFLRETILADNKNFNFKDVDQKLAGYFYITTLGANIGSAGTNLMQPILTTGPMIGVIPTLKGMASVIKRIPKYLAMRKDGVEEAEALGKLFPEFDEAVGGFANLQKTRGPSAMEPPHGGARGAVRGAKNFLMAPFAHTELFNRLSSFEGARLHLEPHVGRAESIAAATQVTDMSQLWAGDYAAPSWQRHVPSKLLTQFTTFPSKMAGIGLAGAYNLVTGKNVGGGLMSPGTLGRAMLLSGAAYEGVRGLGGPDISRSLLTGALPQPSGFGPWPALPFVPPFLDVSGAVLQDAFGSDEDHHALKGTLPLLIPAGVQFQKFAGTMNPTVAAAFGRNFVDTSKETPDGRIPINDDTGRLVGYTSQWDMTMGGMGVPGKLISGDGTRSEDDTFKYILAQKDTIRSLRRDYIGAYLDGDLTKASRIAKDHQSRYGLPIQVRDAEWKAAKAARMLPRMQRALQGVPEAYRATLAHAAAVGLGGMGQQFLGVDPALLGMDSKDALPAYESAAGQ